MANIGRMCDQITGNCHRYFIEVENKVSIFAPEKNRNGQSSIQAALTANDQHQRS